MAFISAVLDEEVAYGFEGGPEYSTSENRLENGVRYADSAWEYARHKYNAQFDNLSDEARAVIINVFHAVRGKRHSFKFKDWNDYIAEQQTLQVTAEYNGTTNAVQLYKTYEFGVAYTVRPIQALVPGTCQVFKLVAGTPVLVAGVFNNELGTFTPDEVWDAAATYIWSGEFYVWVHFVDDYNAFTINSWRASTANIELEEDKREVLATNVPASWEE